MSHKLKLDLRYPPLRRVGFGCVRRYAPGRSLSGSGLRLIAVKRSPLNDQSGDGPGIVWIGAFSPPLVLTSVNILYFTEFCASSLAIGLQALIVALGRDLHPERPYADPRVRVIIDDARAAFRALPAGSYDLNIGATAGSHKIEYADFFVRPV